MLKRLSKDSLISKRPKSDFKKSTDNYFLETKYKQLLEENDKLKKEVCLMNHLRIK